MTCKMQPLLSLNPTNTQPQFYCEHQYYTHIMDSCSFEGFVLDPSKCSKLSMEEKRELVYEVSEWSKGAPELLQSWSRQEILQILCAEMGKERKYTGLTKLKIIEHLLKIVAEKRLHIDDDNDIMMNLDTSQSDHTTSTKRHRKSENPNRLNVALDHNCGDSGENNVELCKNSACRAKLIQEGVFCKRCSCCICHQYDDNKDPSLWLICSSDPPFQGTSCGMSCHLECVLKHDKSGIPKDGESRGLDGSFYCVSCGKVNDLIGCWRKQMIIARDTRRVDILCYRVSLSQKLLAGSIRYQKLDAVVNEVLEKLEADVGPLTGLPVKRARGIVNRLSSGQEVQKLCSSAIESLDSVLPNTTLDDPSISTPVVGFGDVFPTSIYVILGSKDQPFMENFRTNRYIMWHRKAEDKDYPTIPTCTLFAPSDTKFLLSDLAPSTQYILKVINYENTRELGSKEISFQTINDDEQSPQTNSSSLSDPLSIQDENNNIVNKHKDKEVAINTDDVNINNNTSSNDTNSEKYSDPFVPSTSAKLPITPCKAESIKDSNLARKRRRKSSKINLDTVSDEELNESDDQDFGYYVKVIRLLECEGHIDTSFRKKFLTWYSLRASQQEVRVVKVFVDTLMDDPASLAGQLVDTFSDVITNKTCSSSGLCLKLFH
uniref:VIN3-like protein 2 n=1 Tax=Erigeron canadensis TaxID=72917 RepID=UPI001CB94206|nr:VIN3-like protein 2 [Erigeron canadensis]